MKRGRSIRGWLAGGLVVVMVAIASLVLVSGLALTAIAVGPEVPPVSAPAPVPAADAALPTGRVASIARPAPRPVPTPTEGGVLPSGQASELPLLIVPGLMALAALGLVAVQRRTCLPGASARQVTRPSLAPCQEGAR